MTRKELTDLITLKLVAKATIPDMHDFWQLRTELVDALWPVLAEVWANGNAASEIDSNPYEDVPA